MLRDEIARLQRSCHRLIWLNPLIGTLDYAPLTRGLQAALPFVDDFLPVRTLRDVRDLALHLSALAGRATMDITGSYTFAAPPERVWDLMMDPAAIASCIPGCEALEPDGDDRYRARDHARHGRDHRHLRRHRRDHREGRERRRTG